LENEWGLALGDVLDKSGEENVFSESGVVNMPEVRCGTQMIVAFFEQKMKEAIGGF
jgi:hypothetical protein